MGFSLQREPRVTPFLVVVLGVLAMGGAFAMDTYLPALPDVAAELRASPALVQLTLTTFLVGQGLGQLAIGPMSDRWGRWRPLLLGSAVFLLAGLGAVLSTDIWALVVFRFLQGVGAAAGPVIGRAVVADLARGVRAARLFGILMMLFGLAPVIAPVVGGPLAEWGGWRATMWAIVIVSAITLLGALTVPESLPRAHRRLVRGRTVVQDFAELVRNRYFFTASLLIMTSFGVIATWLSTSSFVLQGFFGLSPFTYSLAFAVNSAGFMLAGLLNTLLLRRLTSERILAVSVGVLFVGGCALLTCLLVGALPFWLLLALVTVTFSSVAPILANATALGIGAVESNRAGAASALMGGLETFAPAVLIPILGLFPATPAPMITAFTACATICLVLLVLLLRTPKPQIDETRGVEV